MLLHYIIGCNSCMIEVSQNVTVVDQ